MLFLYDGWCFNPRWPFLLGMHAEIYEILGQMEAGDPVEKEHLSFAKDWILSGKEIIRIQKPDIPDIHLVTYCVVLDLSNRQILLGAHRDAGLWLPPGGHCDRDEWPLESARRELREEIGMEANFLSDKPLFLSVTKTRGPHDNNHTDVGFWYVSTGDASQRFDFDELEFEAIRWFSVDDLPKTDPHMMRFLNKMKVYFSIENVSIHRSSLP